MMVSIIIPAYNAESVLRQCVESILCQAHPEVEVIIVNDGSKDETLAVATGLSEADGRVRVISQDNAGVSSARNVGLQKATGDIVLFVDADDALFDGSLEFICSQFAEDDVDCLVFGMVVEPKELTPITLAHRLAPRDAVLVDEPRRLLFEEYSHPYAFRVAFSRRFLVENSLCFDPKLSLGEDEALLFVAYRLAHRVVLSSRQLYAYRMSEQSASHKDNASEEVLPAKLEKHLMLVASVMGEWKRRDFDRSCDDKLLDWCLDLLMLDVSRLEPDQQAAFYQRLWHLLTEYFGPDGGRTVASSAARPCLRAIQKAAFGAAIRGPVINRALLARFYISSRGISAVAERAAATLRGKGAYA